MSSKSRILFIDAFDSFSNNIIALLETRCAVQVIKITITTEVSILQNLIRCVSAVVIGPGPGLATSPKDTGNIEAVWSFCERYYVPVLGICLGFQTLVLRYGGSLHRLPRPRHGIRTHITSCGTEIFEGMADLVSVQYHSNFCSIKHSAEKASHKFSSDETGLWNPTPQCPDLIPLAWDFDRQTERDVRHEISRDTHAIENPSAILMSVKCRKLPFYGVQFHPESVRSDESARKIVTNWWSVVSGHRTHPVLRSSVMSTPQLIEPLKSTHENPGELLWSEETWYGDSDVLFGQLQGDIDVLSVIRSLKLDSEKGQEFVLLDSELCQRPELGTCSVIGIISSEALHIQYRVGDGFVRLSSGSYTRLHRLDQCPLAIFSFLKSFMNDRRRKRVSGPRSSPFWGGLVGYISYEAGLETLQIAQNSSCKRDEDASDVHFVFVERSIVLNHEKRMNFVQSVKRNDYEWIEKVTSSLRGLTSKSGPQNTERSTTAAGDVHERLPNNGTRIQVPDRSTYEEKIGKCLQYISNGDSYELCLTDQTKITIPLSISITAWDLYLLLRSTNPAPFGAYAKLRDTSILSSSPERFLSWTRPRSLQAEDTLTSGAQEVSVCQFRPIKGTVRKQYRDKSGHIHHVNRKRAEYLLSSAKEEAENLMIADLIRHDLAGVIGSSNVFTRDLMRVEEYETVYQLVTVIQGHIISPGIHHLDARPDEDMTRIRDDSPVQGIDVLAASLPPGSMTGAPKKRSCEILQELEGNRRRSIYSGVFGYLDVGGGGDFSVMIRTAFKHSDANSTSQTEDWFIGAGGAITNLSTLRGEWKEMCAKLDSVLPAFQAK